MENYVSYNCYAKPCIGKSTIFHKTADIQTALILCTQVSKICIFSHTFVWLASVNVAVAMAMTI